MVFDISQLALYGIFDFLTVVKCIKSSKLTLNLGICQSFIQFTILRTLYTKGWADVEVV